VSTALAQSLALAGAGGLAALQLGLLGVRLHRARWSLRWITREMAGGDPPVRRASAAPGARVVVLLPCLNEQSLVDDTLDYFSTMPGVAEGRVLIVPITGESEAELNRAAAGRIPELARRWWAEPGRDAFIRHNGGLLPLPSYDEVAALRRDSASLEAFQAGLARLHGRLPSTASLIDRWTERHAPGGARERILRLHEPATQGSKASKLNFAVDALRKNRPGVMDDPWTYLAIYDFDSRPARGTFAWVLDWVDERAAHAAPLPTVLQQVPHPLGSALDSLRPTSLPYLWAVTHTERTLGLEAYDHAVEMARAARRPGHPRICMGAGMHLRARDLAHAGPFPHDSDDIAFGHRLDWLGCRRALIPHPNLVQPAPSAAAVTRQSRRIFATRGMFVRELAWVRRNRPETAIPRPWSRVLSARLVNHWPEMRLLAIAGAVPLAWFGHSAAAGLALGAALYAAQVLWVRVLLAMGSRVAALHGQGFHPAAPLRSALLGSVAVPALRIALPLQAAAERALAALPLGRPRALPGLAELKTER
jgi:hypothetical protein